MKTAQELLTSHNKFHITLGLERIEKILDLLGNPQEKYKCIHIAGTNGKGSTSKIINDILVEHFKNKDTKIGLFTSPHLFSYTERIKINNEDISNYFLDRLLNDIDALALKNSIELSEFELLTAAAFYYFAIKKVKYVVLEVGLGGLYDATNIINNPLVEAITTIDLDHTQRLGTTIEEIALQKAGIIKKGSKVAILKNNSGYEVIKKEAKKKNAEIIDIQPIETVFEKGKNWAIIEDKKYEFNLLGAHQKENLSLALGVIFNFFKINKTTLKNALKNITWRFRLEYHKKENMLIDGAHNPSGITTLRNFLDENYKDKAKTFIFGCLNNKDYIKMLNILLNKEDEFYFFEFNYPNVLKFDELPAKLKQTAKKITTIEEVKSIIKNKKNLKIFCGSLYMLGSTFKEIELN